MPDRVFSCQLPVVGSNAKGRRLAITARPGTSINCEICGIFATPACLVGIRRYLQDGTSIAWVKVAERASKSPQRLRTERLQERTFAFAKRIVQLCPKQYRDDPSRVAWRQLLRSATGASAILDEADEATSDADFVYRMKTVLRETKESRRWLRFIFECELQHHELLGSLCDEARQLSLIFATIIRNTQRRLFVDHTTRRPTSQ